MNRGRAKSIPSAPLSKQRSQAEVERWKKQKEKLEIALRRARG